MTPRDLAERVHELREERDLSQRELAEKVGYAHSTISKAENYRQGDGMIGTRLSIIEELTGNEVEGPFYRETA